ncbi:MAG TPA: hypothetical protein VE524_04300 [Nitrososphaeraceae archaeon]|jgi:hypothetical protein|nr:hypothetical protein [Nitrososphaeraceae archaeon]
MPRIISPDEKRSVIEDWLDGETREDIAINHNIAKITNLYDMTLIINN